MIPHRRPSREPEPAGHHYFPNFVSPADRRAILAWLTTLHPVWEYRYPTDRDLPSGCAQRRLLRPVYWLGTWQFACLDYYRPPRGTRDRCMQAEPFPPVLDKLVSDIHARVQRLFPVKQVPRGFRFNTCLVNFYGTRKLDDRWVDSARVGEHRDFEPGPVASVSLGERALFQFVTSRIGERGQPLLSQWLDDGSLQLFGGPLYKDRALHRVQRVDRRDQHTLPPEIADFRTRRVNLTFRYVPEEHIVPFECMGRLAQSAVREYLIELAQTSAFFQRALDRAPG